MHPRVHSHHDSSVIVFFFNDTATTEIYTLSLHVALPISGYRTESGPEDLQRDLPHCVDGENHQTGVDRKSTRLNSSHPIISYAVFCLKKKKIKNKWVEVDNQTIARETKVGKAART